MVELLKFDAGGLFGDGLRSFDFDFRLHDVMIRWFIDLDLHCLLAWID